MQMFPRQTCNKIEISPYENGKTSYLFEIIETRNIFFSLNSNNKLVDKEHGIILEYSNL
jgi:hypothetical protein